MLDSQTTVARAVLDHSECAAIFQRHRIDYCCKGGRSIAAAAEECGLDADVLLGELQHAIDGRHRSAALDPATMSTPSLIAHIVATYHDPLRRALPFMTALAAKVGRVHGEHEPRLPELAALVGELEAVLSPHLDEEEQILFPALAARASSPVEVAAGLVAMHDDHLAVATLLERLRDTTGDYQVPASACTSYRTLFSELESLEGDIRRHVHLENHVLMPRFVAR